MNILARTITAVALSLGVALAPMAAAVAQDAPPRSKGGKGSGGGGSKQPQQQSRSGGGNKTGKIVGGIAAGIAGAIILNEIAKGQGDEREYRGERYYGGDGRLSCRQLERRCDDGQGWACRKLDREC